MRQRKELDGQLREGYELFRSTEVPIQRRFECVGNSAHDMGRRVRHCRAKG